MDLDDFMKKKPAGSGKDEGDSFGNDFSSDSFGGLDDPIPGQDSFGGLDDPLPASDSFGGLDDAMPSRDVDGGFAAAAGAESSGFDFNPPPADEAFPSEDDFPTSEEYQAMEENKPRRKRKGGGFMGYLKSGLRIGMLKKDAIDDVAGDPGSFVPALFVYLFPSVVIGIVLFGIVNLVAGGASEGIPPEFAMIIPLLQKASAGLLIFFPLIALIGTLVSIGLFHLFARLFKGEGGFLDYYQTMGVGSLVSWGGFIPVVGILFSLWMIPVMVVITSRVHNLSTGKSVAVVLMPVVLLIVLSIALVSMAGMAAFMGGA